MNRFLAPPLLLLGAFGTVFAQSSASYRLEEHALNAGGHPSGGATMSSASFQISLDSLGEGVLGEGLASASYAMDGGLLPAYSPPGEVGNLVFTASDTLDWDAERSAGSYNLYRDALSALSGGSAGSCEQQDIAASTTTDAGTPGTGSGWFYLVTVENRLGEEGTRGSDGGGAPRPETGVCP